MPCQNSKTEFGRSHRCAAGFTENLGLFEVPYSLSELLSVAVCAVLCGADDFVDIALRGRSKLDWLCGFAKLEQGVPSHDTFARVFGMIDPQALEAAFLRWVGAVVPALAPGSLVALDGKTSRRTKSKELECQ